MPLPSLAEDLNHRYAGSVVGIKRRLESQPFKVVDVVERGGEPIFQGYVGEMRKNRWSDVIYDFKVGGSYLNLNTPATGYVNCFRESPMFAVYFERVPNRQYRRGVNKESHRMYLMIENQHIFKHIKKLVPSIDVTKPRYLYYVYNRRYLPFEIAIDLITSGKALSVALNKRYGLFLWYPWDAPAIQFEGRNIGVFKDNKFLIIKSAMECSEELFEITGRNVEVVR